MMTAVSKAEVMLKRFSHTFRIGLFHFCIHIRILYFAFTFFML